MIGFIFQKAYGTVQRDFIYYLFIYFILQFYFIQTCKPVNLQTCILYRPPEKLFFRVYFQYFARNYWTKLKSGWPCCSFFGQLSFQKAIILLDQISSVCKFTKAVSTLYQCLSVCLSVCLATQLLSILCHSVCLVLNTVIVNPPGVAPMMKKTMKMLKVQRSVLPLVADESFELTLIYMYELSFLLHRNIGSAKIKRR